jgi:hypothetical protein
MDFYMDNISAVEMNITFKSTKDARYIQISICMTYPDMDQQPVNDPHHIDQEGPSPQSVLLPRQD